MYVCAYVVDSRDIAKTEQDETDDATKTSTAGKQAGDVKTSDVYKVEVRNICCVNLILRTNGLMWYAVV